MGKPTEFSACFVPHHEVAACEAKGCWDRGPLKGHHGIYCHLMICEEGIAAKRQEQEAAQATGKA